MVYDTIESFHLLGRRLRAAGVCDECIGAYERTLRRDAETSRSFERSLEAKKASDPEGYRMLMQRLQNEPEHCVRMRSCGYFPYLLVLLARRAADRNHRCQDPEPSMEDRLRAAENCDECIRRYTDTMEMSDETFQREVLDEYDRLLLGFTQRVRNCTDADIEQVARQGEWLSDALAPMDDVKDMRKHGHEFNVVLSVLARSKGLFGHSCNHEKQQIQRPEHMVFGHSEEQERIEEEEEIERKEWRAIHCA